MNFRVTKTIFLVMKLTGILLFCVSMNVAAKGFSQKIDLSFRNASLKTVFKEIERQSGMTFYYNEELLEKSKKLNINVSNASLEDALELCLNSQRLHYEIIGKTIVIKKSEVPSYIAIDKERQSENRPDFLVLGTVMEEFSEEGTTVPLSGATVTNRNTKRNTLTDSRGNFTIQASDKDVLVISFVGYEDKLVTVYKGKSADNAVTLPSVGGEVRITVRLTKSVLSLNEAVVIGYGTARKKDLTGSVSVIDGKEIRDIPYLTFDNALAGKAAGVQITKTDGTPGGMVRLRVRGSTSLLGGNDPLYVIDGVPVQVQSNFINPGFDVSSPVGNSVTGAGGVAAGMSTAFVNGLNSLGGLNPDDIESISVLKDASSSAIYGSKAANGVIIITTKKGRKDMKPRIEFSYYTTMGKPVTPKVLDAAQYKMLLSEAAKNSYDLRVAAGTPIPAAIDNIVNSPNTFFGKHNTNWIKEVTRNTLAHNAEVSVAGGSSSSRYFTSVSFTNMPGVVKGSTYQRVSGKLNLENEIGTKLKFITNMIMGYIDQNITNGAYSQALSARPDYAPLDPNGNYTSFAQVAYSYEGFQNPVAMLNSLNNSKTFSMLGSISGIYDITRNLQFKSILSLNSQTYNQRNFTPSYIDIGSFYGNVANNGGIGSNSNSRLSNWFFENTLTYTAKFRENHDLNVMAGTSYETRKTSFFSATASGFPDDNVLNNLSSAITPLVTRGDDPTKPQSYLLSFYLRANYAFRDKYLFTFTGRADGSSKFGPANKFGYFPSAAVAWRVSEENFMSRVSWISDLKLRASYGLTGTQNIGDQMYRTLYSPLSYAGNSALIPTQLGNSDIKWETTSQMDVGLDASLFNNRLHITADYYNKQTDGALLSLPVSPSSSYGSLLSNVVDIRNKGFEFSVGADIIRTPTFRWSTAANITFNRSLVTKISDKADLGQIGNLTGLESGNTAIIEGKPLGLLTGMNVTGIIRTQKELDDYKEKLGFFSDLFFPYLGIGDPMLQLDSITYADYGASYPEFRALLGEAAPKFVGGISQTFGYKNFDLGLYFTYSQGGRLFWGEHVSSIKFVGTANANQVMLNRYTPENSNTSQPRLLYAGDQLLYNSSLSLFKSSYIKLRSVSLSYRFNRTPWMNRAGVQQMSLFLSATNVFTITKYPGNDPETSDDPYSVAGGYFDVGNYPMIRTLSIGLKAAF